jgi:hypothetical protein
MSVLQAIFTHQGPALERELAELKGSVQDADAALETAKAAMKNAGLVQTFLILPFCCWH